MGGSQVSPRPEVGQSIPHPKPRPVPAQHGAVRVHALQHQARASSAPGDSTWPLTSSRLWRGSWACTAPVTLSAGSWRRRSSGSSASRGLRLALGGRCGAWLREATQAQGQGAEAGTGVAVRLGAAGVVAMGGVGAGTAGVGARATGADTDAGGPPAGLVPGHHHCQHGQHGHQGASAPSTQAVREGRRAWLAPAWVCAGRARCLARVGFVRVAAHPGCGTWLAGLLQARRTPGVGTF